MRRLHLVPKKKSFIVKFTCSVRRPKKSARPAALVRVTVVRDQVLLFIHNTLHLHS